MRSEPPRANNTMEDLSLVPTLGVQRHNCTSLSLNDHVAEEPPRGDQEMLEHGSASTMTSQGDSGLARQQGNDHKQPTGANDESPMESDDCWSRVHI